MLEQWFPTVADVWDAVWAFVESTPYPTEFLSLIGVYLGGRAVARAARNRTWHESSVEHDRRRQADNEHWRERREKPYMQIWDEINAAMVAIHERRWQYHAMTDVDERALDHEYEVFRSIAIWGWGLESGDTKVIPLRTAKKVESFRSSAARLLSVSESLNAPKKSFEGRLAKSLSQARTVATDLLVEWERSNATRRARAAVTALREDLGIDTFE